MTYALVTQTGCKFLTRFLVKIPDCNYIRNYIQFLQRIVGFDRRLITSTKLVQALYFIKSEKANL